MDESKPLLLGIIRVPLADLVAKAEEPLGQVASLMQSTWAEEMTLGLPAGDGAPGGGRVVPTYSRASQSWTSHLP